MAIHNADDLFERQLGEMLSAEDTFLDGMRMMEQKATDPTLKRAIGAHIRQTETQVDNIRQAFRRMGKDAAPVDCPAARGLVDDYRRNVREIPEGGSHATAAKTLLDSETATTAAMVEHYEVGAYKTLITNARKLGKDEVVPLLQDNLRMEERTAAQVEDILGKLP